MSANKLGSRSVAAVIAAIMALSPIGSAAYAATKQPVKRPVVGSKVSPAAKVPRQINRPPSLPIIQSKRNDNSGSGKNSTIAGKANNPAQRVPSMLPSASNELRERLKEPANGKSRALKPSTGAPVASVSGSARAELSSQIKAGVAGSAINTDRLSNIRDRVAGAGQFRDRVDTVANSALQQRLTGSLEAGIRSDSVSQLADGADDAWKAVGVGVAIVKAAEIGGVAAESFLVAAPGTAVTGAAGVAASGYAGYKVTSALISATSEPGWFGDEAGQTDAARSFQNGVDTFSNWLSRNNTSQNNDNSQANNSQAGTSTQTANAGSTTADAAGTTTGTTNGGSNGSTSSSDTTSSTNSSGSNGSNGTSSTDTASNGSNTSASGGTSGGSCDGSADSGQCTSSADGGGSTPAPAADSGSEGSPNPLNDTSTRGSIVASMALDRMLGGNQTRQQDKDRAARTGGGVTTPFDGAETSNVTANLAIDRQFNTGYASRQEDHLNGKQGGNVGQPGDDVNWNRNKTGKADLNDLNVVKAMQTGIKTPTVDQGNAGNKAPKAPTVGGGYTGGGGGTTASQAPVQGAASVSTGTSAAQSVQSAVQTRLRNAMSSAAGQVREQANSVR